jgi:hypothetical protein
MQGCDKNDNPVGIGKGDIRYSGGIFQLHNAQKITLTEKRFVDGVFYYYPYFHVLTLTDTHRTTRVRIVVRSESNKLESGEFYVGLITIDNMYNSIQMEINLSDTYVLYPNNKKANLSIAEKDGVFDIELQYVDGIGNFFIKYEGLVKET